MHTIGIDFGTTKTLVSRIITQTGRAETVRLGQGADHIPTSLFIRPDGSMLFGNDAEDLIAEPSGVYLRGFKMKLGSSIPVHAQTTPDGEYVPYMASTLVTRYLAYIRQRVQDTVYAGEPVTRAIITRPVDFSPARLAELHKAALDAGFREVELTTEPEAAGLAFCRLNDAQAFRHSALIVDWGGGTLDVALVTREGNRILTHPKLTAGDTTIGGENFDHLLWQYAQTQLRHQGMSNINPLPMLPVIRKNKEKLSAADCATLRLSHEHGTCPPIEISRTLFNSLIQASVDRAAFLIRHLLEQIPPADKPEILLLVGGSCSIPLIKQTLEETCQLPAIYWHLSREAVSLGAALWDSAPTTPPATTAAKTESAPVTSPKIDKKIQKAQKKAKKAKKDLNASAQASPKTSRKRFRRIALALALLLLAAIPVAIFVLPTDKRQQAIEKLHTHGIYASSYDENLITAIKDNNTYLLQLLIDAGADVNQLYTADFAMGSPPLFWAAYYGHAECVKLLLAAPGIDVNRTGEYGATPLYRAAYFGHDECVKLLLAAPGIDVNKADKYGYTPLSTAEINGHTECARLLEAAGAKY